MSTQVQGSNILDVLKKKMRQTKEEMEKYKEDYDDSQRKLQVEIMRREEVSHFLNRQIAQMCTLCTVVKWEWHVYAAAAVL